MSTSALHRPLQVYLDSSDFSNLSHPERRKSFENVERQLLVWQAEGLIELRFSYVHVIEAAPIAPEHIPDARARTECIARLCGPKALKSPADLFVLETRALQSRSAVPRDSVLVNNGNWMPDNIREIIDLPPIGQLVNEDLANESLNRAMRRKLQKNCISGAGRLRSAALSSLKNDMPAAIEKLKIEYPMTEAGIAAAKRYLLGKGSRKDVEELMVGAIRDLRMFMDWYVKQWGPTATLSAWFREEGEKLYSALTRGRDLVQRMVEAEAAIGTTEEELSARLKRQVAGMPLRLVEGLAEKFLGEATGPQVSKESVATYLPGVWAAANVLSEIVASTAARMRNQRKADDGDFGDAMHCVYLPYVDVFRVDVRIHTAIKATRSARDTTVVGRLQDLLGKIQERLATRYLTVSN